MQDVNQETGKAKRVIAAFLGLVLGRKAGVNWGQQCSLGEDGKVSLPHPKDGGAEEIAAMTRQALYCAGLEQFSTPAAIAGAEDAVKALFHPMEAARVEAKLVQSSRGARLILSRGLDEVLHVLQAGLLDEEASPEQLQARAVQTSLLIQSMLKASPKGAFERRGPKLVADINTMLPQGVQDAISNAAQSVSAAQSSEEILQLAQQLWADLQQQQQPPEDQQPSNEQSQDQTEQEQDQQDGQGDGQGAQAQQEQPDDAQDEGQQQDQGQPGGQQQDGSTDAEDGEGQQQQDSDASESKVGSGQGGEGEQSNADQIRQGQDQGQGQDASAEQSDVGGEEGGQSSQQQGQAQSGNAPSNPPGNSGQPFAPDLGSLGGQDLGQLMQQAYEAKFGEARVDPTPQPQAATESEDGVVQALKDAMDGKDAPVDLDKLIGLASQAAQDADDQEAQAVELDVGAGAGGDNVVVASVNGSRMTGVVSRLTRVFIRELQDQRSYPTGLAMAGASVVADRMWRLKRLGDAKVFRQPRTSAGVDAAVQLLMDRSGSTKDFVGELFEATTACAIALERLGRLKTAIELFPARDWEVQHSESAKAFGASARALSNRTSQVESCGTTPMHQAMQNVLPTLLDRREKKKMLFILTDGIPDDVEATKVMLAKYAETGVTVVGIGMGPYREKVVALIPNSVAVESIEDLPHALEKLFKGQIVDRLAA